VVNEVEEKENRKIDPEEWHEEGHGDVRLKVEQSLPPWRMPYEAGQDPYTGKPVQNGVGRHVQQGVAGVE
jgi:hypothetical protein